MKQYYTLLIVLVTFSFSQAQIVNIPDANFKSGLIADTNINTNGDTEIQVSEAEVVTSLDLSGQFILSLEGIQYFTSLNYLDCSNSQLTSLNVTQNTNLLSINCNSNQITSIDLSQNTNLKTLHCSHNQLISLDLTQNTLLETLYAMNNQLISLNVVGCSVLNLLTCNDNQLTSLNVTQNQGLTHLLCSGNQLASLDVTQNTALNYLHCYGNQLTDINITQNIALDDLNCSSNQLASIDVSQNANLVDFFCNDNQLTVLDVAQNPNLTYLSCSDNQLTSLDLTQQGASGLKLRCNNNQLTSLFAKNGDAFWGAYLEFSGNPNLAYICIDSYNELGIIQSKLDQYGYSNCIMNRYCSFNPGGTHYTIQGETIFDYDNNGCDISDVRYPNLKFSITNNALMSEFIGDDLGAYLMPVQAGIHTITPQLENSTYFSISPSSIVVNFPTDASPYTPGFCITSNGVFNDLEMSILPTEEARPGFDTGYKLVYKNKGTTTLSGNVTLAFNDDLMNLVSATPIADVQTTGNLTWNYTNLLPLETRSIDFTMNINTPTDPTFPVVSNDVLDFTATINPEVGDETPRDNVFELHQTVVNAYDPNDKTCLEGATIVPNEVGEYVHYMIRFENTGSANATNIVVKDVINVAKYDISTLIPMHGSHSYVTRIRNTRIVEFIFENINLPFDNANNDGYVAFKIKTGPTLVVNDTFENNAEIYFDYNAPIITNVAQTTVAVLGLADYEMDNSIGIHPNPAKETVYIQGQHNLKEITVFDVNGRVLNSISVVGSQLEKELDVTELTQGIYFVRVVSNKGQFVSKLIKE